MLELVTVGEVIIGPQPHLRLAVRRADPRPVDPHAPAAERHLTVLVAVANRGPLPVPLRTDDLVDLLLQQLPEHAEPDLHRQRQQPFLRCADQLLQRLLHPLREHGLLHDRLSDRYVALHGGSSFDLCRITRHAPTRSGRGEGPPSPQSSTSPGQAHATRDCGCSESAAQQTWRTVAIAEKHAPGAARGNDRSHRRSATQRACALAPKGPRTAAERAPSLTIPFARDARARDLDVAALLSDQVCPTDPPATHCWVARGAAQPPSAKPSHKRSGPHGQSWPCRSAWLLAFRTSSLACADLVSGRCRM